MEIGRVLDGFASRLKRPAKPKFRAENQPNSSKNNHPDMNEAPQQRQPWASAVAFDPPCRIANSLKNLENHENPLPR
jgi:hypothetical protein